MCGESYSTPVKAAAKVAPASGATFASSLAGTGKRYVQLQARIKGDYLHVQVVAPGAKGTNRTYGLSTDVTVPSNILRHFKAAAEVTPLLGSQAKTTKRYLPMQATTVQYSGVHFQARDGKLNREYGLAFDVEDNKALREFIKALLEAPEIEAPEIEAAPIPAPKVNQSVEMNGTKELTVTLDGEPLLFAQDDGSVTIETAWGTLRVDKDGGISYDDGDTSFSLDGDKGHFQAKVDGVSISSD